jgi:hypothetical protein
MWSVSSPCFESAADPPSGIGAPAAPSSSQGHDTRVLEESRCKQAIAGLTQTARASELRRRRHRRRRPAGATDPPRRPESLHASVLVRPSRACGVGPAGLPGPSRPGGGPLEALLATAPSPGPPGVQVPVPAKALPPAPPCRLGPGGAGGWAGRVRGGSGPAIAGPGPAASGSESAWPPAGRRAASPTQNHSRPGPAGGGGPDPGPGASPARGGGGVARAGPGPPGGPPGTARGACASESQLSHGRGHCARPGTARGPAGPAHPGPPDANGNPSRTLADVRVGGSRRSTPSR